MSIKASVDVPIDLFGGLVLDMNPADLPPGVSPDCQDLIFSETGPRTRPGLQNVFPPIAGNPTVNYLKTFVTGLRALRTLVADSLGNLWKEVVTGTLTLVSGALTPSILSRPNSVTLFTREYIAFGNGKYGLDIPRQYDDTNFDRVSQVGPGAPPVAADSASAGNISVG